MDPERGDPLRAAARRAPRATAVEGPPPEPDAEEVRWSYAELDAGADRLARGLIEAGAAPGERIGMRFDPSPEAVLVIHAAWRLGAVVVPVNPRWTEAEARRGLDAAGGATLRIGSREEVAALQADGRESHQDLPLLPPDPDRPAAILLTSGSTGSPAPVAVSRANLAASARGAIRRLGLVPRDRWLAVLSPGHVGGYALLHRCAVVGSTAVTRPRFDASEVAGLLEGGRVTHASLVPVMLARLLDYRGDREAPSALRCLLVGGAATPGPLLARALALGYPVALTYGLTETTSQIATATPAEVRAHPGTVGKALPGTEIRIDRAGAGRAGGVGEILVRGPTIAVGAATAAAVRAVEERDLAADRGRAPLPSVQVDERGWLHTGDLGRLDEEGNLWVVGRLSERIVSGGVTVEPAEVEAVVVRHPRVREVAAFGIADAEWGERVVVAVVPENPAAPPSLDEILALAREELAPAKRPRELRIVPALPRNASGKVDRSRLDAETHPATSA